MTVNTHIAISGSTGLVPARAGLRRVEKARQTSDLGNETMREREHPAQDDSRVAAPRHLSQSETEQREMPWHGTVLRPAFVAQVLGQVMADPQRAMPRAAFTAYRDGAAARPALALDQKI